MLARALMLSLVAGCACSSAVAAERAPAPIARYRLNEGAGDRVADASGHGRDGRIIGGTTWIQTPQGTALVLNGSNYVRVDPTATLGLDSALSISIWAKGQASRTHLVEGAPGFRGPDFQVCGDRIVLVTNDDYLPDTAPDSVEKRQWSVWTGSADIALGNWSYRQQTRPPFSGIEPKMQVVGDRVYYEYFGQDANRAWQIWTARSSSDGSGWEATVRTAEKSGYRVEQDDNIQVAGNRVYLGFPRKDEHDVWQLWTGSHPLDGSRFEVAQRTDTGGWIPSLQVVGDTVYYLFVKSLGDGTLKDSLAAGYELYMAAAHLDGSAFRIIRKIGEGRWYGMTGWGTFRIDKGIAHLAFSAVDAEGSSHLFTGRMKLDGTDLVTEQRTFGKGYAGAPRQSLEVVGSKVHYTYGVLPGDGAAPPTTSEQYMDLMATRSGSQGYELWSATAELDGSHWQARLIHRGPPDIAYAYKGLQVVGAKRYLSTMRLHPGQRLQGVLGVGGANLVSKGDAFGIGVTEDGLARGFVNAGQDYRFRGEAPSDVAGATADAAYPDAVGWHQLVMTFDRKQLKLYVDGKLTSTAHYTQRPASNPFPLLLGDGFQGLISDVSVFDRALSVEQIGTLRAESSTARSRVSGGQGSTN